MQPLLEFERLKRHIENALEYAGGTHTLDDVRALVEKDLLQLWPGIDSAVLTQIMDYPRQRALHFFLAGGNLDELKRLHPIILKWGIEHGCTRATFAGRRGWERTFLTREEGWTVSSINMEKDLTHG